MVAVRVKQRTPEHWRTQFRDGATTRRSDCGVWAFLNALDVVTAGALDVGTAKLSGREAVEETREWMGVASGPTSTTDWFSAWRSPALAKMLSVAGLGVPAVSRLHGAPWSRVREHLGAGRVVMLCVDYGVLRRGPAPVDGSGFDGGHAVTFAGYTNVDGRVWTKVMDSLLEGPRTTRQVYYREAAGRFGARPWGVGKVEAVSIGMAPSVIEEPAPDPRRDALAAIQQARAALDVATRHLGG